MTNEERVMDTNEDRCLAALIMLSKAQCAIVLEDDPHARAKAIEQVGESTRLLLTMARALDDNKIMVEGLTQG